MKLSKYIYFIYFIFMLSSCEKLAHPPSNSSSSHYPHSSFNSHFPLFIWGFSIEGFPISEQLLSLTTSSTKINPECIQFYLQWTQSPEDYISIKSSLEAISMIGAVPCITWEPMFILQDKEIAVSSEDILKGKFDFYLNLISQDIKKFNRPLILRFAHEMNIDRYHWGGTKDQYDRHSPSRYIKMYRYIVDYFRKQKVANVSWAFSPNVDSTPNEFWNTLENYYPGNDYVDILGMDGYNWNSVEKKDQEDDKWTNSETSFEKLFEKIYHQLRVLAPEKPIMVFETASTDHNERKKTAWIKNAIETAKRWSLIGIIWFQVQKEEDWRVNQNHDYSYVPIIQIETNPLEQFLHKNQSSNR